MKRQRDIAKRPAAEHCIVPPCRCLLETNLVNGCTVPTTEGALVVAHIGSFGSGNSDEADVAALVDSFGASAVIGSGPNAYNSDLAAQNYDDEVGKFYHKYIFPYVGAYGDGGATNGFWPSPGSTDWSVDGNLSSYLAFFPLPDNRRYYDVCLGPVHLFVLDGDTLEPDGTGENSIQANWLKAKLWLSTAPWKVVVLGDSAPYLTPWRNVGSPVELQIMGANLVLSGFPVYERSRQNGLDYINNGSGGKTITGTGNTPIAGREYYDETHFGAGRMIATQCSLRYEFIGVDGVLIDALQLTKPLTGACAGETVAGELTDATIQQFLPASTESEQQFFTSNGDPNGVVTAGPLPAQCWDMTNHILLVRLGGLRWQYRVVLMKTFQILFLCLFATVAPAASPSFNSFNPYWFLTNGNIVDINTNHFAVLGSGEVPLATVFIVKGTNIVVLTNLFTGEYTVNAEVSHAEVITATNSLNTVLKALILKAVTNNHSVPVTLQSDLNVAGRLGVTNEIWMRDLGDNTENYWVIRNDGNGFWITNTANSFPGWLNLSSGGTLTVSDHFSGTGDLLTELNASELTIGTVPMDRLNPRVVTNNNATLTSGRVMVGNGGRGIQNATASGAVPINANGTATGIGVGLTLSVGTLSADTTVLTPAVRTINTTTPLAGGGDLSTDRTFSIANAAADGSTKGASSYAASDFDVTAGNVTLDYANGQAASASVNGFLSSANWTTFNGKQAAGNYITALTGVITASGPGSAAATFGSFSSATLATALTDETGSGGSPLAVFNQSPTIVTPTIASFVNATHSHQNAAGGGALDAAATTSGVFAIGRLATGTPNGSKFVRDDGTLAVPPGTAGNFGTNVLTGEGLFYADVNIGGDLHAQNIYVPTGGSPKTALTSDGGISAAGAIWQVDGTTANTIIGGSASLVVSASAPIGGEKFRVDGNASISGNLTNGGPVIVGSYAKLSRPSAAVGAVIFQTDNTPGLRVYNGTHWVKFTEANDD
jgi:tartrate-resistant acid phosphatase type 5